MSGEKAIAKPYSVSSLTGELKLLLERKYTRIYVEAEISGWKVYPSGHAYFTLKDTGAQIQAVMFASALSRCRARAGLKDGAKVLVYGNLSVYPPRGNYQLTVLAAKLAGEGDLMQRYLELKEKLESEGLFDPARKRPLPKLPRRIAIVTSEAGAVIHDMCTVLTRRFPALEIRLYPSLVQGAEAPDSIVKGIEYFNGCLARGDGAWKADVLIVARGGGSFEDLFCFNDETLVRAVASSLIPTVSAVGHESDFTLCDFAADVRAGTPSIAAEMVVPVLSEIVSRLSQLEERLSSSLRSRGEYFAQRTDYMAENLERIMAICAERASQRTDRLAEALGRALVLCRERVESRLLRAETGLALLSPYSVLERGYSLTVDDSGAVVKDSSLLSPGSRIKTRFCKGEIVSEVVA